MSERRYAGKSGPERRLERREALVGAGYELLSTQGAHRTTVRAVFEQAGLSQRYFYENFASLDELLVAVFDRVMHVTMSDIAAAVDAETDVPGLIEALVGAFVRMLEDPKASRIALVEALSNEALLRRRLTTLHSGATTLATAVRERGGSEAAPGAIDIAAFSIVGGLLEAMLASVDGSLVVSHRNLRQQFTTLAVATMNRALQSTAWRDRG